MEGIMGDLLLKIQKFIVTSLVTAVIVILFSSIFEESFSMFDYYDILIIFTGLISAILGLMLSKRFFRFEFENNTLNGSILGIISWMIYVLYFFVVYNMIYPIDLVVLVGLLMGFFLYFILLRLGDNFNASKLRSEDSDKGRFSFLVTGMRIVSLFSSILFGGVFGFMIAQFSWMFFSGFFDYPGILIFAPLTYTFGWIIVGILGYPLHYASKGKIIV